MDLLTPTLSWIRALQTQDFLLGPMKALTFLGNEEFFLLLLPILYWLVDRKVGTRLGVLLLVSVCLNGVFKLVFHMPRPYWSGQVEQWATETTFGFPSGHAQNSLLIWLFLAFHARNRKLWVPLALLLAFLISLSRVYLGAHYPLDILGGWTLGALLLWAALRLENQVSARQLKVGPLVQISVTLAFSLFLVGGYWLAYNRIPASFGVGSGWQGALAEAFAGKNIVAFIAAFNGLVFGLAFTPKWSARGVLPQILGRFVLGFAGLFFFYFGLKKLLPDELAFRFARYFLTTFWVACGAPMLFLKLKLARLENLESEKVAAQ